MARMDGATWRPVRNFRAGGSYEQRGLVLHVQQGDNSPFGWFNNPESQASSDFWVAKDGTIEQYVNTGEDRAWAQAAGNAYYASVETEGYVGQPLTTGQIDGVARIMAWGHHEFDWPLEVVDSTTARGLTYHGVGGAAWGGHPDCPGPIRRQQRYDIIERAKQLAGGYRPVVSLSRLIAAAQQDPPAEQGHVSYRDGVVLVEQALCAEGLLSAAYASDGSFGTLSVEAYAAWQERCGFEGADADGIPGRTSLEQLGDAHGFAVVD